MCGIAGYSAQFGRPDLAEKVPNVLEAIKHRGPDGHGLFFNEDESVGIAHVRLAIIDLNDTGSQPMLSEDRTKVLSFNGEIYNFIELREELEAEGHLFHGASDTEVLLRLLETKGLEALPCLNGIFAFALYDEQTQELVLVRDAYGVKPLYYCDAESVFTFGSEIRALLAMGVSAVDPKPEILGRYLSFLWNPGSEAVAHNIYSLPPGAAITVKEGRVVKKWKWFKPPILSPKIIESTDVTHIAEVTHVLREAVHRQMVSDVPIGAFLSGGLDSSAIVAFGREIAPDLTCFTIETAGGPEEGSADDLHYARRVARHLNVPLEVVHVDPSRIAEDFRLLVWQLEEPIADPAGLNVLYISRLARQQGLKVLMSGAGGDDLFTGYRRHRAVALDRHLQRVPKGVRRGISALGDVLDRSNPTTRRIAKFLDGFSTTGEERLINYFLWAKREDVLELFKPELLSSFSEDAFIQPMQNYLEQMSATVDPINLILALEQRFFLAEHNLIYTDKMSMAAGVEVRVPFLDLKVADYAASLPLDLKQRGRVGKWILKKAMEPFLPHDVIYRPKAGFGAPLRRWLRHELKDIMYDLLSFESLSRRNYFDATAVHRLIALNESGKRDASYTIFSLMCIEMWCRLFLDEKMPFVSDVSAHRTDLGS